MNMIVNKTETKKNPAGLRIGGIVAAAAAAVSFIVRFLVASEMKSIEKAHAAMVIVGSEQMSKADYLEYASGLISTCNTAAIVLLILAVILFVCWLKKK